MKQSQTTLDRYGFTRNHFGLLLAALAVFTVLVMPRAGIKLSAMFSKADTDAPMITYEQTRGEVYAQMGIIDEDQYLRELENQFALLDRGMADGAVLGESIGIGAIPNAEQVFSRELLDQIVLNVHSDNSKDAMLKYAENVLQVESANGSILLLANLNSSDAQTLMQTKQQAQAIVSGLKAVSVPSALQDLHRYKMIYYQSMAGIAEVFATGESGPEFETDSKILFSVMDKIEKTKLQIRNQYQVEL